MRVLPRLALAAFIAASAWGTATAEETAEARGEQIAREAKQRDAGFGDYTVQLTMTLRAADGRETLRKLRAKSLEVPGDGDKTMLVFDEPKDVRGAALLTHAHRSQDDDRWLFLPALKRVKRLSSANQSGPFMGSELAYEDLGSVEVEKYTYRFVEEGARDEVKTFVFERYPVNKDSGYNRQVVTLDQSEYRLLQVDYFDRKNALLKTLTASEYQKHGDRYWKAGRYAVINHQTGKSTTLDFQDYRFKTGLTGDDLDPKSLEAVR